MIVLAIVHVAVDHIPHIAVNRVPNIVVERVTKPLAIEDSGWAIFAACASAIAAIAAGGAAIATGTLAFLTWQSVTITRKILANENANFKKAQTARLIERYLQAPIQITAEQSVTAQNAFSDLLHFASRLDLVMSLKAEYQHPPASEELRKDEELRKRRRQYRAIMGSFTVILNFYRTAAILYSEDVIDRRMFLNSFADSFLSLWDAMPSVNAITESYRPERLKALEPLRNLCQEWMDRMRASKTADVPQLAFPERP